jgi:GNAT superfamily N-acetyltransferase
MDYVIRRARPAEHLLLADIERSAGKLFETAGMADLARAEPASLDFVDAVARCGAVLVAVSEPDDVPVGFLLLGFLDRTAHIYEVSVAEGHGRRGLGAQLIEEACRIARREGLHAATLSTFLDVPWNGPFYERLGFRHVHRGAWTPAFHLLHDRQIALGLQVERRGFMRKDLT